MLLNRFNHFRLKRAAPICDAKGAIIDMPPCASGNLCHFGRRQFTHMPPVKFHIRRQRHMLQIKIKPHANGICRDQEIDIAILIEFNLGIPCPRAKPPHDNSGTATLTADGFSQLINISHAKGDNCTAPRQSGELFWPGIGQARHAMPCFKFCLGKQQAQQWRRRIRAHEHCLELAAGIQDPVREHMATLAVPGKLHLINSDKFKAAINP